ncbi:hypothetical protein AB0E78_33715 [Streptomyces sp. NPDC032198]
MRDDTNPRLLRAFLAVAEELHFTRAAAGSSSHLLAEELHG